MWHACAIGVAAKWENESVLSPQLYAIVRDTNTASMGVASRLGMTSRATFVRCYRGGDMPHSAFAVDAPVQGRGRA